MILITRPLEQGRKTKHLLEAKGLKAICFPMFKVVERSITNIENAPAVIITSQNAVPTLVKHVNKDTKIFAVGEKTGDIIRSYGFKNIASIAITAEYLLEEIKVSGEKHLLYLRGNKVAHDLKSILESFDIEVAEHIAYEVIPISKLNNTVKLYLEEGKIDKVLFYSANTAKIFAEKAKSLDLSRVEAICISKNAATPIEHIPWKNIKIAKLPNENSLIDEIEK